MQAARGSRSVEIEAADVPLLAGVDRCIGARVGHAGRFALLRADATSGRGGPPSALNFRSRRTGYTLVIDGLIEGFLVLKEGHQAVGLLVG